MQGAANLIFPVADKESQSDHTPSQYLRAQSLSSNHMITWENLHLLKLYLSYLQL